MTRSSRLSGMRPTLQHCLCRTASAGSIDSTASRILALRAARLSHRVPPHFDELRRPANLALQVTFNVIYSAAPACSRVDSVAPAHSDIRPSHCAAPGAGAELVVLVFEVCPFASRRSSAARLTPDRPNCLTRLRSATIVMTRALENT